MDTKRFNDQLTFIMNIVSYRNQEARIEIPVSAPQKLGSLKQIPKTKTLNTRTSKNWDPKNQDPNTRTFKIEAAFFQNC